MTGSARNFRYRVRMLGTGRGSQAVPPPKKRRTGNWEGARFGRQKAGQATGKFLEVGGHWTGTQDGVVECSVQTRISPDAKLRETHEIEHQGTIGAGQARMTGKLN